MSRIAKALSLALTPLLAVLLWTSPDSVDR